MSHFGRSGPPDIAETYSLLVLNISFSTTADDLFPYFDKYGEVMDVFIPKDKRTGESRGFAFVRYKYQDEAQKAVDRLDGKVIHGREIAVQFAKYGPNAERIHKGRISEPVSRTRSRERSRSPPRRYRDDYYRSPDRSRDRYDYERYPRRESGYNRSRSRSLEDDRGRYDRYRRSPSDASASPRRRYTPSPRRSLSPPRDRSRGGRRRDDRSPTPGSASPRRKVPYSRSPSPRNNGDVDV